VKQINFVPQSFDGERTRQRRIVGLSIAIVAVILSGAVWSKTESDRRLEALQGELSTLVEETGRRQVQAHARHREVTRTQLQCRLEAPVPAVSIIALVADHIPPSVGLASLSLIGKPIDPDPGGRRNRKKNGTSEGQAAPPPVLLVLQGVAPDDMTVARFIERLDSQPLFERLELGFCRPVEGGPFEVRDFEVTAEIPLDRTVVLDPPREVAHAD
jgi:hypothetical protein